MTLTVTNWFKPIRNNRHKAAGEEAAVVAVAAADAMEDVAVVVVEMDANATKDGVA